MFARRLQIQERLTNQVAETLMKGLEPKDVAVVVEASHLCMEMRGVEKTGSKTVTRCVLGCFEEDCEMRSEFFGAGRREVEHNYTGVVWAVNQIASLIA